MVCIVGLDLDFLSVLNPLLHLLHLLLLILLLLFLSSQFRHSFSRPRRLAVMAHDQPASSSLTMVLKKVLSDSQAKQVLAAIGDHPETTTTTDSNVRAKLASLEPSSNLSEADLNHVRLVSSLADLTSNDPSFVRALVNDPSVNSLRDIALNYDDTKLHSLLETNWERPLIRENVVVTSHFAPAAPPPTTSTTGPKPPSIPSRPSSTEGHLTPRSSEAVSQSVASFQQKLFHAEPSAVVQRLVQTKAVKLPSPEVQDGVAKFFANNPDFNIRKTSVLQPLSDPKALNGVPEAHHDNVKTQLKTLQTAQALTPTPDAIPALVHAKTTTAMQVANMSQDNFVKTMSKLIPAETARGIHSHSTAVVARNNNVLTSTLQTMRGAGLRAIDGPETKQQRIARLTPVVQNLAPQVDLEQLFGSLDYCECDDCCAIDSPAAYFVDLMEFLRNNNLDPVLPDTSPTPGATNPATSQSGYSGTLLADLMARRPDIGNLELTCANTNTVLPYIDLANEVMESYVVYLNQSTSSTDPSITVFNVGSDETTSELLAAPQHTNYQAYCILKSAVYPPTVLPYNQPIDSIRINLDYLGTSRYELLDVFHETYTPPATNAAGGAIAPADQATLTTIHETVHTRATDAEFLQITLEEYVILTKEVFWPLEYFILTSGTQITPDSYRTKIGVRPTYEYWGLDYTSNDMMRSVDESNPVGLAFVKNQLLRRASIVYTDLVSVLKTSFINPHYPQGPALAILDSIQFSYRFLQRLVDTTAQSKTAKFAKLIAFLIRAELALKPPPTEKCGCQSATEHVSTCQKLQDLCNWVYCWFERIGKLIVLESGEGPLLPWEGYVYALQVSDARVQPTPPPAATPAAVTPAAAMIKAVVPARPVSPVVPAKPTGLVAAATHTTSSAVVSITPATATAVGVPTTPTTPAITAVPPVTSATSLTAPTKTDAISNPLPTPIAILHRDGSIVDYTTQAALAYVHITGKVLDLNGHKWVDSFTSTNLIVRSIDPVNTGTNGDPTYGTGQILTSTGYLRIRGDPAGDTENPKERNRITWASQQDDCNIDLVRLRRLDGSSPSIEDYDRLHRFLRLWHKMGWSIDETDVVLSGLGRPAPAATTPTVPVVVPVTGDAGEVDFSDFMDTCASCGKKTGSCGCKPKSGTSDSNNGGKQLTDPQCNCPPLPPKADITADFIHQLVAFKKLLTLTGLSVQQLATFWAEIDIFGDSSLYSQLFLTHNIVGVDPIFQADSNGNYLTGTINISDHIPVILAATKLRPAALNAIIAFKAIPDVLSLQNISIIYRHALLAQVLQVQATALQNIVGVFGDPFTTATTALCVLQDWNNMGTAGFSFAQMNYLLKNMDDPLKPVGPSPRTILKISKTICDGLNSIVTANPDVASQDAATDDAVTAAATQLFDASLSQQIVAFLDGTTAYTTKAPANLTLQIPADLQTKLKYAVAGQVSSTGILTAAQIAEAKALSTDPKWSDAIDRLGKQALWFFNTSLSAIFVANPTEAITNLVQTGDDATSAVPKRLYFLQHLMPFLRDQLSDVLIFDTLSGAANLSSDTTQTIVSNILITGTPPQSALAAFRGLQSLQPVTTSSWTGYIVAPSSDSYTFAFDSDTQPAPLLINGQALPLATSLEDPLSGDVVWFSAPFKLVGGQLCTLQVAGDATKLQWKTARSPLATIPSSSLLADYTNSTTSTLFASLWKVAMFINNFSLSVDEIGFFQAHPLDFAGFDLNQLTLDVWRRMFSYTTLRTALPKYSTTLLQFFVWATQPDDLKNLTTWIGNVTPWLPADVTKLISPTHFNLADPSNFKNEKALVRMQKAWNVAQKINTDIDLLFSWATTMTKFWDIHKTAASVTNAIRSKYSLSDWEQVAKPLNDKLRTNQQAALAGYLIVNPALAGVVTDADSLFDYFLIDVQMCPCMQTSRIKQATSSIQVFIQRCLMGLESDTANIANIDRNRWTTMQKYRLEQAAIDVFLWPENYIVPSLRDDKSPFYQQFESELLQKDVSLQTMLDAVKNYLFKVDEVASLQVVGLYQETVDASNTNLHVFGRTPHAPFTYYYRVYSTLSGGNWSAWSLVQIDIPNIEVDNVVPSSNVNVIMSGSYLIPFTYQGRLMIAVPQFSTKTIPASANLSGSQTMVGLGSQTGGTGTSPTKVLEVRMGISELQNGKWTQKKVSTTALYSAFNNYSPPLPPPATSASGSSTTTGPTPPPPDDPTTSAQIQFVPRVGPKISSNGEPSVFIDVYVNPISDATASKLSFPQPVNQSPSPAAIGRFALVGGQLVADTTVIDGSAVPDATVFGYWDTTFTDTTPGAVATPVWRFHSLQSSMIPGGVDAWNDGAPYFDYLQTQSYISYVNYTPGRQQFDNPWSRSILGELTSTENLNDLYSALQKVTGLDDFLGKDPTTGTYNEMCRPNAIYAWEVGFHIPMALVDNLLNTQQFDLALQVLSYVFDPLAQGTDPMRFWNWVAFQNIDATQSLTQMFESLQPNQPDTQFYINEWRDSPFLPHSVARARPVAYMKYVAMKYIQVLITYGDYYFTQNTLETLPLALQCYILASHIYGPRAQKIPKRGKKEPQTYNSLVDKWDAFGNAMVQLELQFPFSNQIQFPYGSSNGVTGAANIWGFATELYFCVPSNAKLMALRDTIDDRLYKVRHCEDINGVFRILPLYEPPIDPLLLVEAAAQGLSLASVLNDLNTTLPNYRFPYMLAKAIDLCGELKSLGGAFLSAKEKGDGEALQTLRASHELSIANLVMTTRTLQVSEAQASLDVLTQNRAGSAYRMKHHLQLLGTDLSAIPQPDQSFNELNDNIEIPTDDSGLKLIPSEQQELSLSNTAADLSLGSGALETLAGIFEIFPEFRVAAEPWGVGASENWGPPFAARAMTAVARGLRVYAEYLNHGSTNAGRTTGFKRNAISNSLGANSAGYELVSIDKQIAAQTVRISMANQEITNQQAAIDNSQAVVDFLANKYSNADLYAWMSDSIRTLYRQTYDLAYGWAKKAEMVYQFERNLNPSVAANMFIQYGYWDVGHDGLLAGEHLFTGLKALEASYNETRGWDFEIQKLISLRLTAPLALLTLRETGTCTISLPEVLFDMDFPGHYQRKIKSVALTFSCLTGPYTSVNATLRLTGHKYRTSAIATSPSDYAPKIDTPDPRFSTANIPLTAVAISTGQNDAGVFELSFKDERYVPFEGAGAISSWTLQLPPVPQFEYASITDVVMQVRYTAVDGGDALAAAATGSVQAFLKQVQDVSSDMGLFSVFDIRHDFSVAWRAFAAAPTPAPSAGTTSRTLTLTGLAERFPIWTRGYEVVATDITLLYSLSAGTLHAADMALVQSTDSFVDEAPIDAGMQRVGMQGTTVVVGDWVVSIDSQTAVFRELWLMVRYVLK